MSFSRLLGGFDKIAAYSSSLANEARDVLEKAWGTTELRSTTIGVDLEAPFMKVLKLPPLKDYVINSNESADAVCSRLIRRMIDDFQVVGCVVPIDNELYVRISAFVYNSIDDYERLGDAILALKA